MSTVKFIPVILKIVFYLLASVFVLAFCTLNVMCLGVCVCGGVSLCVCVCVFEFCVCHRFGKYPDIQYYFWRYDFTMLSLHHLVLNSSSILRINAVPQLLVRYYISLSLWRNYLLALLPVIQCFMLLLIHMFLQICKDYWWLECGKSLFWLLDFPYNYLLYYSIFFSYCFHMLLIFPLHLYRIDYSKNWSYHLKRLP